MLPEQLAYSRLFWDRYEWRRQDDFAYEFLEDHPVPMKVSGEFTLLLDPGEDFCYISLEFLEQGKEGVEVAWDDEGHFHPYVFRVEELQAVSERIARLHQVPVWIPGLLLRRFVGIDPVNEQERESALQWELELRRQSGLYKEEELDAVIHPTSRPAAGLHTGKSGRSWRFQSPYGWIMEGEDAYSLRHPDCAFFPFAGWNRMLQS